MTKVVDDRASFRGWIEGPRWAGIADFLQKAALELDVDIDVREGSGLLRRTVYFTVEGPKAKVELFKRVVATSVAEYQS